MTNKQKLSIFILNVIIITLSILGLIFLIPKLEWYIKALGYCAVLTFGILTCLFLFLKYYKLAKCFFIFNLLTFIILLVFFVLNIFGIFNNLSDMEKIKNLILKSGGLGVVVCVLVQLLQVVILPAPATIFYLATTAIYGSLWGFVICYLTTVLGSIISFFIGKSIGLKAVQWCIGKENTLKYSTLLNKKGKVPFVLMQLLPFFPDDILCMVAGLSSMSYKFFIATIILVKPIYIAFVCFLGTGNIIPFSSWGIPVWIGIFSLILIFGVIYYKNQDKVDDWIKNKFSKSKKL